jgi:hypothetical protein
VKGFLRVCINIILGRFFKNTLYFNSKKSPWGGKILLLKLLGNSVGVSINHYKKFNVGKQGAILNNSKVMGTSQLGGVVYGNPNLNGLKAG